MAKAAKKKTTNSEHKNKLGVENSLVTILMPAKKRASAGIRANTL